ncbi:MAG: hypothetical protein AAGI54_01200 [Planctomycetota bacterium]
MTPTLDQPSTPMGLGPASRAPSLSGALSDDGGAQPLIDPGLPWLVVALVAAVLLRVGLLWLGPMTEPARSMEQMPAERQALASTLIEDRWYAMPSQVEEPAAVGEALEAVGLSTEAPASPPAGLRHERYELPGSTAVSATLRLGSSDPRVWPIAQATMSVLTVLLAFVAVSMVWGRAAGAVAAWVMALAPALIIDPLAMQPIVVPLLLILGGVALLADRRAGPLNGILGGGCVGVAGLFAAPLLILGPVFAGWVALRQRNLAGLVAGVLALVATGVPIAAWTARGVAVGVGPIPTVAPIVGVLDADAAVAATIAAQTPADPLDENPFGPTAAAVNLSQPVDDTDAASGSWSGLPIADAVSRLIDEPGPTSGYLLGRVAAPFIDDRSGELHGLLGLTAPDGSSIERWLAGDYFLTQSPAPLADAMALTTLAAWGVMIALVPFGLAIAAWRRRWGGLLLVSGMIIGLPVAALFSPSPDELLPISLVVIALAASGLATRPQPRAPRLDKPRRKRKAKAKADPGNTAPQDEPVLSRLSNPAHPPAPANPEPLAQTTLEPIEVEELPNDPPEDEDTPGGGLKLPKLPSVDRMAAAYDVPEDEAPEEVLPRRSGRPI